MPRKLHLVLTVLATFSAISFAKEIKFLTELSSGINGDRFGAKVINAGDVNNDGFGDMLICADGSYTSTNYAGKVSLYLGGTNFSGKPAIEYIGEGTEDHFGINATTLGDINGDGFSDFAISADKNNENGNDAGKVYIYFGAKQLPAKPSATLKGERANEWFGTSISGGHDLNGDGKPDFIIGAPYAGKKFSGTVYVYFGGTDITVPALTLTGENAGDAFGYEVCSLGDVTGDGIGDFAVSALYANVGSEQGAGVLYVFAGGNIISKKPVITVPGKVAREQIGYNIAAVGDITADGVNDILVGAPGGGSGALGAAYVFAGGTLRAEPVASFFGAHQNSLFGMSVASAGDVTGDGINDFMIGAPYTDAGSYHAGKVEFFAGGKTLSVKEAFKLQGIGEENQCGYSLGFVPNFFGKNSPLYSITWAGAGSGNIGKSRVVIYK